VTVAEGIPELRGASFPFRIDPRSGAVATTAGGAKLRENVEHLLLTRVGERTLVRDYGGGVTQLFQENVNDGIVAVARHQISTALLRFEPRVLPQEITVNSRNGELLLVVRFLEAETPGPQATVIPIG
jgi:phage baseplate assembly protein W